MAAGNANPPFDSGSSLDATLAEFIICPSCGGDFELGTGAVCGRCGASHAVTDDIVSLIGEGAHTALDEIDYDAVYRVDAQASQAFAKSCLDLLGDRLPHRIASFLEIGAGTGLFTLGFLQQVPTTRALITDISPSMLDTCRRRLLENGIDDQVQLRFATWDGANCLRADTFDLIAGFSVLHHVLDYQSMLSTLRTALRSDGVALFLEPNYRFHLALIDTLCEIFIAVADDERWTPEDRGAFSDWLMENNTNLRFRGDERVLAEREDKHLFDGSQMDHAARHAGFDHVDMLPLGGRGEAYVAVKVYSDQIGLQDAARNDLLLRFTRLLPGQFSHLAYEDRAPSTLIVLRKGQGLASTHRVEADSELVPAEFVPTFLYDLMVTVAPDDNIWTIAVQGWVLGDVDVNYLQLILDERRHRFPVRLMRQDIDSAFNSRRIHPLRRTLFSGIDGARPQEIEAVATARTATLLASGADGREFVIGELVVEPDAGTYTVTQVGGS